MTPDPRDEIRRDSLVIGSASLGIIDSETMGLAMRVIAVWSYIDLEMMNLIRSFVQGDYEVITHTLARIDSAGARRAAYRAAAEVALEDDELGLQMFTKMTKRLSRQRKSVRDKYAHSLFAVDRERPKVLILVDPRYLARLDARFQQAASDASEAGGELSFWRQGHGFEQNVPPDRPDLLLDRSQLHQYTQARIQEDLEHSWVTKKLVELLAHAVDTHERNHRARSVLCETLDIAPKGHGDA